MSMYSREQWEALDEATQALSIIIGNYAVRLREERRKPERDENQYNALLSEQNEILKLRESLRVKDFETIRQVIKVYAPQAKSILGKA